MTTEKLNLAIARLKRANCTRYRKHTVITGKTVIITVIMLEPRKGNVCKIVAKGILNNVENT